MKTLDEIIKKYEMCGSQITCSTCPYSQEICFCDPDMLHYLKELRHILDNTVWIESTKEENGYWKLPMLPETGNDPLTWDELRTMEGKPVWVEQYHGDTKGWLLILRKCDDVVTCTTKHGNSFYLYKANYGEKWQAYRKERK